MIIVTVIMLTFLISMSFYFLGQSRAYSKFNKKIKQMSKELNVLMKRAKLMENSEVVK